MVSCSLQLSYNEVFIQKCIYKWTGTGHHKTFPSLRGSVEFTAVTWTYTCGSQKSQAHFLYLRYHFQIILEDNPVVWCLVNNGGEIMGKKVAVAWIKFGGIAICTSGLMKNMKPSVRSGVCPVRDSNTGPPVHVQNCYCSAIPSVNVLQRTGRTPHSQTINTASWKALMQLCSQSYISVTGILVWVSSEW